MYCNASSQKLRLKPLFQTWIFKCCFSNIYPRTNILQIRDLNPPPRGFWCLESGTRTDLRHTLLEIKFCWPPGCTGMVYRQNWKYSELVLTVMSTNIRIFEYSNKMALEYYSYSYSCHFPSTNIFGYSFVDFWTTEYIWIFIRKFSKIRISLNICSELYFNIWLPIFNEKSKSRYNLCIKNIPCKILFRGNMSKPF